MRGRAARKTRPILRTPAGEPPGVVSVSPSTGSTGGGTTITITLDDYVTTYGVVGVTVGDVPCTDVTVVDRTTVTAVTGARSALLVPVEVSNHWGTGVKNAAFQYTTTGDALLLESGDYLLLESGDRLLLE